MLFEAREKRVRPGRDDKILAGWNGLMIRGLAFAARVFERPDWAELARRARRTSCSATDLWRNGTLTRCAPGGACTRSTPSWRTTETSPPGLTALYQATFEPKYLEARGGDRRASAVELFWDEGRQAYLSAPKGQKDLICATYALHDNAFPSGASSLTEAQVALGALTGRMAYLEQADEYVSRMHDEMTRNPFAYGHLLLAADSLLDAAEVTLVGDVAGLAEMVEVVNAAYAPTVAVLAHDASRPIPQVVQDTLKDRGMVGGATAAYFCRHFACELPVTTPAELRSRLNRMSAAHITSF